MKYLFFLILLASCGTDDSKNSEEAKNNVEPPKYQDTPHALAADELPKCDQDNQKQLVYIIPDKQFYTCEGDGWQKFEIVLDQVQQKAFLWQDQVNDRFWYILGLKPSLTYCGDSGAERMWERQTPDQIKEALRHGIFKGVNLKVWTDANIFVYSDYPETEYNAFDYANHQVDAFTICLVAK